jgi:hypothetical protein
MNSIDPDIRTNHADKFTLFSEYFLSLSKEQHEAKQADSPAYDPDFDDKLFSNFFRLDSKSLAEFQESVKGGRSTNDNSRKTGSGDQNGKSFGLDSPVIPEKDGEDGESEGEEPSLDLFQKKGGGDGQIFSTFKVEAEQENSDQWKPTI